MADLAKAGDRAIINGFPTFNSYATPIMHTLKYSMIGSGIYLLSNPDRARKVLPRSFTG
jgi:hypothetical protein